MGIKINVATSTEGKHFLFECPGCGQFHGPTEKWKFNGDLEKPTFSPSILVTGKREFKNPEIFDLADSMMCKIHNIEVAAKATKGSIMLAAEGFIVPSAELEALKKVAQAYSEARWKENRCHSFVENGMIRFLDDCTHELAGKTVEIPDWNS